MNKFIKLSKAEMKSILGGTESEGVTYYCTATTIHGSGILYCNETDTKCSCQETMDETCLEFDWCIDIDCGCK